MSDVVPVPDTDDEAWLAQLRKALDSAPDDDAGSSSDRASRLAPTASDEGQTAERRAAARRAADTAALADVCGSLQALDGRLSAVESLAKNIASVVRRASSGPAALDLEKIIVRVLRAELPALLQAHTASQPPPPTTATVSLGDETMDRWAQRAEKGEVPSDDVVLLAHELRGRVSELEDLQRQAFDQMAAERRALIEEMVREIHTMLFGR